MLSLTTFKNLGPSATNAIPALLQAAQTLQPEELRREVLTLLDRLDPNLRHAQTGEAGRVAEEERTHAYLERLRGGQCRAEEVIASIYELPKAASISAEALGNMEDLLSKGDRPQIINAKVAILEIINGDNAQAAAVAAKAFQKLQPDRPRPLYSNEEVKPAFDALTECLDRADK